MANNKSAKKRIQIAERNRLINKSYKSTVRTLTKKTLENCEKYKKDPNDDNKLLVKTSLNKAFSLIDKAVKKMFYTKIMELIKNQKSTFLLKLLLLRSKKTDHNYERYRTHRHSLSFNI